ncbi:M15 family metallopeptidase [Clostridium butyricum]|uniref:M15 family metallopeptidase n=1 Tax=Clostridium butyricum TaxID=1492 RepID=UPI00168AB00D|nr:M15 family metallopeptidase [Clostridium butyricum]MDB2151041.1 M15 family metallopeptidase [Clostridium butyricum]
MRRVIRGISIILVMILGFVYFTEDNNLKSIANKKSEIYKYKDVILVNGDYGVGDYKPEKLVVPNIEFNDDSCNEEKKVSYEIKEPLENMINDAKSDNVVLIGNSAYRSYKSQKEVYNNRVNAVGRKKAEDYVAKPGFSEHQTGLCIDVTNRDKYFVKGTEEADWIANNCYKYGFIIRYPEGKENITGISYEPWHIRYVGKEIAKQIHNKGITLEEYLGVNQ